MATHLNLVPRLRTVYHHSLFAFTASIRTISFYFFTPNSRFCTRHGIIASTLLVREGSEKKNVMYVCGCFVTVGQTILFLLGKSETGQCLLC